MIKLPERKYEPKHNSELRDYAKGWNASINSIDTITSIKFDETRMSFIKDSMELAIHFHRICCSGPFSEGRVDCLNEIKKLNNIGETLKEEKNEQSSIGY